MANRAFQRELFPRATPEQVFHALYADQPVALWIEDNTTPGATSSVLATGEHVVLAGPDWLDSLRTLWSEHRLTPEYSHLGQPLGLLVVVPYDASSHTLGLDADTTPIDTWGEPVHAVIVRRSLSVNRDNGVITAWALADDGSGAQEWSDWVERELETALASTEETPSDPAQPPLGATWRDAPDDYRGYIDAARESIRDGDVYQLCLTTQATVDWDQPDWLIHHSLRQLSPSPYQALIRTAAWSMISASPETFLRVDPHGRATTKPIKGTRPRAQDPVEDLQNVESLLASQKEQAENLMIVDLMRNDFLKVCSPDSIGVTGLFEVESYATVHQLVSTVVGDLADGHDPVDLLAACFPAGSMTGAPKQRAVEWLARVETGPRGLYAGAWGWARADGSLDLAMTIRTAVVRDGQVSVGVGGGITWSSQVDEEIAEVGHKARGALAALGVTSIQYS